MEKLSESAEGRTSRSTRRDENRERIREGRGNVMDDCKS